MSALKVASHLLMVDGANDGGEQSQAIPGMAGYDELPLVLTCLEFSRITRTGRNLVYDLIAERKIRAVKAGNKYLIPRSSLIEWLEGNGGVR